MAAAHVVALLITGTDGIMLVVYRARPGTDDAGKLALLASVTMKPTARAHVPGS